MPYRNLKFLICFWQTSVISNGNAEELDTSDVSHNGSQSVSEPIPSVEPLKEETLPTPTVNVKTLNMR